ncbi:MAG: DNA methyltransferase, partial [bacterium]
ASLMLNRMMFVYFIQKRGFLDSDHDYLRNRLHRIQSIGKKDKFHSFYRLFLLRLFHEGLGQPEAGRAPELADLLGKVPFLNGGLFDVHELERENKDVHIPDKAFEKVFDFFDAYTWHLDERPLRSDNEINPDVLGYIFEKYINQKEMGAYYTKEDITGYISRNTIIPFLFDAAQKECPIAFAPDGGVWRLLKDNPDRYIYSAMTKGVDLELPGEINAGLEDVSKRQEWNSPAPQECALPTETWREHVTRRKRCQDIRRKLLAGEIRSINDLITYNLDICRFAEDVIVNSEGPELLKAFWKAIQGISVLDPTCGSGAFLFAALNILEPLYTACLEGMQGFLDDLQRSQRKHHPNKLKPFRDILKQVAQHPNQRYFVLKSIVIQNLYGVDIMEEAVEICKLRLFLKLVAQVGSFNQIEPLPDIDFNIRAGNTLVGFTSLDEVRDAVAGHIDELLLLPEIEEKAEIVDQAFKVFRQMQILHEMDAKDFGKAKLELRQRLKTLGHELDRYLASQYGIDPEESLIFEQWRTSHHPFHWLIEFYGIMANGGFDVVIGNPPWREYAKVRKEYAVLSYHTESCGNLHSLCSERSLNLRSNLGRMSFIVQLPMVSSSRMGPIRSLLRQQSSTLHVIPFDDRPGKLFEGLENCRSVIFLSQKQNINADLLIQTTRYQRWVTNTRDYLFEQIEFAHLLGQPILSGILPKYANNLQESVFRRMKEGGKLAISVYRETSETKNFIFYQEATRYWVKATYGLPFYAKDGVVAAPSHGRYVYFENGEKAHSICAVLNSSLFYLYFLAYGDCFHLSDTLVCGFPVNSDIMGDSCLVELNKRLMKDLKKKSEKKTIQTKDGHKISYAEFYGGRSKEIIDEIDKVLAKHYGFTDEELDFIINYDIKYRMGRDGGAEDDD